MILIKICRNLFFIVTDWETNHSRRIRIVFSQPLRRRERFTEKNKKKSREVTRDKVSTITRKGNLATIR
jgi:hypothetical protein